MASSDETSTYGCSKCGAKFTGLTALWAHTDRAHPAPFFFQVEGEPQQYTHQPRFNEDGDELCPVCSHDDVGMWADDGEADLADWWKCETFSGGCGAHGAVVGAKTRRDPLGRGMRVSTHRTQNGLVYPA